MAVTPTTSANLNAKLASANKALQDLMTRAVNDGLIQNANQIQNLTFAQMQNLDFNGIMSQNQFITGMANKIVEQRGSSVASPKDQPIFNALVVPARRGNIPLGNSITLWTTGYANAGLTPLANSQSSGMTAPEIAIGQNLAVANMYECYWTALKNKNGEYGVTVNQTIPKAFFKLAFLNVANFQKSINQLEKLTNDSLDNFMLSTFINFVFNVATPLCKYKYVAPIADPELTAQDKFNYAIKSFFQFLLIATQYQTPCFNIGATWDTTKKKYTFDFLKTNPWPNFMFTPTSATEAISGWMPDPKKIHIFAPYNVVNSLARGVWDVKLNNEFWKWENLGIPAENLHPTFYSHGVVEQPTTQGQAPDTNAQLSDKPMQPANEIMVLYMDDDADMDNGYVIYDQWKEKLNLELANPMIDTLRFQYNTLYGVAPWAQGFIFQSDSLTMPTDINFDPNNPAAILVAPTAKYKSTAPSIQMTPEALLAMVKAQYGKTNKGA